MKKLYELLLANKSLEAGFEAFIAPELFTNHEDFASFGLSVDLVEKYKNLVRFRPNIKCVFEVTNDINDVQIAPFAAGTCLYGETIGGVEVVVQSLNIVPFTKNSTKRWVAAYTNATSYTAPPVAVWIYGIDLTSIYCRSPRLKYVFMKDLSTIKDLPYSAFDGCSSLTGNVTFPNNLLSIGYRAFAGCSSIYGELNFPATINSISSADGWYLIFQGCVGITSAVINNDTVQSAAGLLSGLTGLQSVQFFDGGTLIGDSFMNGCLNVKTPLTIPNSVTSIGSSAFNGCTGFTGSLTIPNSVTTIGGRAFQDCTGFDGSLTISNSVTTIGGRAFQDCTGFTGALTIPNSVTSIDSFAFSGCSGFDGSLTIPNSVTTIDNNAFYGCTGFTGALTIPNSVTTIGGSAFYGCTGFDGALTIPNSVTTIGSSAFQRCTGFTGALTIPNSVTTIGIGAFYGCSGFTGALTIPNSVTTIGRDAFNSINITSLTVKGTLLELASGAFSRCKFLISATFESVTPPNTVGSEVFRHLDAFPIYVPASSVDDYKEKFTEYVNQITGQ